MLQRIEEKIIIRSRTSLNSSSGSDFWGQLRIQDRDMEAADLSRKLASVLLQSGAVANLGDRAHRQIGDQM